MKALDYRSKQEDFEPFAQAAEAEVKRVREREGLRPIPEPGVVHFSALPWLDFTGMSHARRFDTGDSCPKITIGKMTEDPSGRRSMPVSVHVHHALADGRHIAAFVDEFQQFMDEEAPAEPESRAPA